MQQGAFQRQTAFAEVGNPPGQRQRWMALQGGPAIGEGLCVRERFTHTPAAASPSMSVGFSPGSSDQYDHQPMCAESELLPRLIRPHHPPWMKAVNHSFP